MSQPKETDLPPARDDGRETADGADYSRADGKVAESDEAAAAERTHRRPDYPWETSAAKKKARFNFYVAAGTGAVISIAGFLWYVNDYFKNLDTGTGSPVNAISVWTIVFGLLVVAGAGVRLGREQIRQQELVELKSREAVGNAIDELKYDMSFPSLMKLNQTQMDQYHDITKHQAANAYRNSQIAMILGLLILVVAATAAILLKSDAAKIIFASIASVGATLSAYIGSTFLKAYRAALAQLNFYFRQPLINSYLLSAERLAAEISLDRQDEMRSKIIESMLESAIRDIQIGSNDLPSRSASD